MRDSGITLHNDEESRTEEALKTFTEIENCTYSSRGLGKSRQDEFMSCDCKECISEDGVNLACGENSDCINRLTSIECSNERSTHCGADCRNQRFQNREYASVDVISAGKKGYGLRALTDIPGGTFIYEYIGEVIDEAKFMKRMKQYETEDRRHFYFMMLQNGEFIDATVKGSLARFCNHSCSPNSYVDKWLVKGRLRMGIFAKRDILQGEEITFDYNVDRYGSQVQSCYCGSDNCMGYLGGKTQTEAAYKLPQMLVDALGLDEDDERRWVSAVGKRKKKQRQQVEEEDYDNHLPVKPVDEDNVSKVMGCLLQCRERWLIMKLISRVRETEQVSVHSRVMRMHGYEIFSILLRDWSSDGDILVIILQILIKWPKLTKNKISSSKIESTVQDLAKTSEFDDVKELAQGLLEDWSSLQMAYRIPRRQQSETTTNGKSESPKPTPNNNDANDTNNEQANNNNNGTNSNDNDDSETPKLSRGQKRRQRQKQKRAEQRQDEEKKRAEERAREDERKERERREREKERERQKRERQSSAKNDDLPYGWETAIDRNTGKTYYFNRSKNETTWVKPQKLPSRPGSTSKPTKRSENGDNHDIGLSPSSDLVKSQTLQKIIEQATAQYFQQEQQRQQNQQNSSSEPNTPDDSTIPVEKILTKTFARYIPNVVSRYEKEIGHENVKRFSKDITHILVSKELRPGHQIKNPKQLTEEKKAKIKLFIKSYMQKVLEKYREKRRLKEERLRQSKKRPAQDQDDESNIEPPTARLKVEEEEQGSSGPATRDPDAEIELD
ncbi:hypothetical protein TRICI_004020 [Trichomonascus ciferrii]|uniref:Histone-lysine N-methyltransferase, H3 lysine-36 specific n=1 Tax=Trichomonascus ciferrii TaxID=44093 RepID=A0A642V1M9_9ASCO|nr:hypothetical protein TRICI_004020 [Trichomonascus ciferrii]